MNGTAQLGSSARQPVSATGCVVFKTCVTDARRPLGDGGYAGQIDAFAVYCAQTSGIYLVPIGAVRSPFFGYLKVEPPLKRQISHIRWARDFHIGTWNSEPEELANFWHSGRK